MYRNVDEVIRNWQKGLRAEDGSPMPKGLYRHGGGEQILFDNDLYVQADELILEFPPIVRSCFWAEYAPGKINRDNHQKKAAELPKEVRRRYVDIARFKLERALCSQSRKR